MVAVEIAVDIVDDDVAADGDVVVGRGDDCVDVVVAAACVAVLSS